MHEYRGHLHRLHHARIPGSLCAVLRETARNDSLEQSLPNLWIGHTAAATHYARVWQPRNTLELAGIGTERLGGSTRALLASPWHSFLLRAVAASRYHSAGAKRRRFEVSQYQAPGVRQAGLRRASDHLPR